MLKGLALKALQKQPESRGRRELDVDIRLDFFYVLLPLGEFERIGAYLREAEKFARDLDDHHRLGQVCSKMCAYLWIWGDVLGAIEHGQHAYIISKTLSDDILQLETNQRLGASYYTLGDYRQAVDVLKRNITLLEGEMPHELSDFAFGQYMFSHIWLALCLADLGLFMEGLAQGDKAVKMAEERDDPFSLTGANYALGYLHLGQGAYSKAVFRLERALQLSQDANVMIFFTPVVSVLVSAYAFAGYISDALLLLEQALRAVSSTRDTGRFAGFILNLCWVYLLTDRLQEAYDHALSAFETAQNHKACGPEAYALRLLGDIAMRHDPPDIDQAEIHYQQALTLANELGMRPLQAHCHRGLGKLYGQTGQAEQARTELATAIEMYLAMEMSYWLPGTEAALAAVEGV